MVLKNPYLTLIASILGLMLDILIRIPFSFTKDYIEKIPKKIPLMVCRPKFLAIFLH